MMNTDELNDKFGIEGEVGFAEMEGDLIYISVCNKYSEADICLYGAHVTHFKTHNSADILWMSPESHLEEGKPIRGGIPVCFPWFGPHKTNKDKPAHGFARLMYWEVAHTESLDNGETMIKLQLCSSDGTKAYWDFDFCAELIITLGMKLSTTLKVTNTSNEAFEYSCALHSYFRVSSIENISIDGLQNTSYHNQLTGMDGRQEEDKLKITDAITRHYYHTENACTIEDPALRRTICVDKSGSKTTTVWNPWKETAIQIADMPDEAYHAFVCVETVNAYGDEIHLTPGEVHETIATIGLEQ